jgi:hypothetical protein
VTACHATQNQNLYIWNEGATTAQAPADLARGAGPSAAADALFHASTGAITANGTFQDSPVYGAGGYDPSNFSVTTTQAGDLLVVSAHSKSPSDNVDSVTGGGVASWTRAVQEQAGSGDTTDTEIWYGVITNPGTSTITFNWTSTPVAPGDYAEFAAQEFTAPNANQYATGVTFGGTPATSFTVDSPGQITAIAPPGSGTANVVVTNGVGSSTQTVPFTYTTPPVPATLLNTVAVQGPGNSTYIYWEMSNAQWYGPLGVGGRGTSFSAPSVAISPTSGLPTVAVEGPNNSTYVYWEAANAQWYGPLGLGT